MIILGFRMRQQALLKGAGIKLAAARKQALLDAVRTWHEQVFPRHFFPGAHARYGNAPRSQFYRTVLKKMQGLGSGKFLDNILSGRSRRYMLAVATFSGTSQSATVRMRPPRYFTNPFIGSFVDPKSGRLKRITRQPDKADEVTRQTADDRSFLRTAFAASIDRQYRAALTSQTTNQTIEG